MGKRKKRAKSNAGRKKKNKSGFIDSKENPILEQVYKAQKIVPEGEWDIFMSAMRQQLPITFRINRSSGFQHRIRQRLVSDEFRLKELQNNGLKIDNKPFTAPQELVWYPDSLGWSLDIAKRQLKRVPELASFREFMLRENENGNINRQESVSMIPPLLLDVQPHHIVLDMCAAPGSKTAQLLESLHCPTEDEKYDVIPTGLIMANDAHHTRASMLNHQMKRFGSPNVLITCHDGQQLPTIRTQRNSGGPTEKLLFDRVLCDAPCSGDGTIRKNLDIWRKYTPRSGIILHGLQSRIGLRGAQLLKPGGLLVYSTCSLSPYENEAVVVQLIKQGSLELVDVSEKLPGLKRCNGLYTWKVIDKDKFEDEVKFINSVDEVDDGRIKESVFPPSIEEAKAMHLERCVRVLPHQQNTGAFFIAVLRKLDPKEETMVDDDEKEISPTGTQSTIPPRLDADVATESENSKSEVTDVSTSQKADTQDQQENDITKDSNPADTSQRKKKKEKSGRRKPDYPLFLRCTLPELQHVLNPIKLFYGIKDDFPFENLFSRSIESKRVYFVPSSMRDILLRQDEKLHVVNAGVRLFEKFHSKQYDHACHYRICQEGARRVLPFMTKQCIQTNPEYFVKLLSDLKIVIADVKDQEFQGRLQAQDVGCVVMSLCVPEGAPMIRPICVTGWKSEHGNVTMMVNKSEAESLKILLKEHFQIGEDKEEMEEETTGQSKDSKMEIEGSNCLQ